MGFRNAKYKHGASGCRIDKYQKCEEFSWGSGVGPGLDTQSIVLTPGRRATLI